MVAESVPPNLMPVAPSGELPTSVVAGASSPAEYLVLSLEDLLPDAQGEIVVLDDLEEGITIVTDHQVADQGVSADHVTATGVDVGGFFYCTFDSGVTLYYPTSLKLVVSPETVA